VKRVDLHPLAEMELEQSARFYEEQAKGLGDDFLDEVAASLAFISRFPEGPRLISPTVRSARVRRFPFQILYRLEAGRTFVVAIMHYRRRPGYWEGRL
jgi:toxin ParE1/3/4